MTINICRNDAEGPFGVQEIGNLRNDPGVYAVFWDRDDPMRSIMDIGRSDTIADCISGCDRKQCWRDEGFGHLQLWVAVIYADIERSYTLEEDLLKRLDPICRERHHGGSVLLLVAGHRGISW